MENLGWWFWVGVEALGVESGLEVIFILFLILLIVWDAFADFFGVFLILNFKIINISIWLYNIIICYRASPKQMAEVK